MFFFIVLAPGGHWCLYRDGKLDTLRVGAGLTQGHAIFHVRLNRSSSNCKTLVYIFSILKKY